MWKNIYVREAILKTYVGEAREVESRSSSSCRSTMCWTGYLTMMVMMMMLMLKMKMKMWQWWCYCFRWGKLKHRQRGSGKEDKASLKIFTGQHLHQHCHHFHHCPQHSWLHHRSCQFENLHIVDSCTGRRSSGRKAKQRSKQNWQMLSRCTHVAIIMMLKTKFVKKNYGSLLKKDTPWARDVDMYAASIQGTQLFTS